QAFSGFGDIETELIGRAASSGFAIVLPIILLFIIVIYLLAVIGTVVNYGGFQARRRGGRIEVEHGLLQRSYRGVGIQRIQAVEVKQGLIRRMIGYAELRLQTVDSAQAASSNSQQKKKVMEKGLILHPFVKLSQVDTIIHGLLPEFDGRPRVETQQTLPRVAIRRTVNRRVFFSALITLVWLVPLCTLLWWMRGLYIDGLGTIPSAAINAILVIIGILFVVIFVFRAFGAVLWYRHARYSWNDSHLFVRHGAWSIDEVFIPHQKIQWGEYKQTPFQRVSKVATIQASTAAGVSGTHIKLRDLRLEAAEAYLAWLCADESSQPVDYREQPEFTQKPVRLDLM
ncbi:MAG: PH domain-containing protein, partial [Coriobacteriia bacterium]|nr:PH domain-containing protein [Coriobacteriia bacterium]